MDNRTQILQIEKYRQRLARMRGRDVDCDIAARLWIRKYARLWRISHPTVKECVLS